MIGNLRREDDRPRALLRGGRLRKPVTALKGLNPLDTKPVAALISRL